MSKSRRRAPLRSDNDIDTVPAFRGTGGVGRCDSWLRSMGHDRVQGDLAGRLHLGLRFLRQSSMHEELPGAHGGCLGACQEVDTLFRPASQRSEQDLLHHFPQDPDQSSVSGPEMQKTLAPCCGPANTEPPLESSRCVPAVLHAVTEDEDLLLQKIRSAQGRVRPSITIPRLLRSSCR